MISCKDDTVTEVHTHGLWVTVLVLVVYGYVYMVAACGVCCFATGGYCLYRSWSAEAAQSRESNKKRNEAVD